MRLFSLTPSLASLLIESEADEGLDPVLGISIGYIVQLAEHELSRTVEVQIARIVDESDSRELGDLITPWLSEITLPDERGQELLDALLRNLIGELPPDRAMQTAFLLGAAWQRACDAARYEQ